MSIRCASKALIIHNGSILLNRCRHSDGRVYYGLPGGGQHLYETMEDAVVREVLEETGYRVSVSRFAALAEEIYTSATLRRQFPDYTHRILHIFLADLISDQQSLPSETDFGMEASVWIPLGKVASLPEICPQGLQFRLDEILRAAAPVYLGTQLLTWETP